MAGKGIGTTFTSRSGARPASSRAARTQRSVAVLNPRTPAVPPLRSFTLFTGASSLTMYAVVNQSLPSASRQIPATILMSRPWARAKITARPGAVPPSSSLEVGLEALGVALERDELEPILRALTRREIGPRRH